MKTLILLTRVLFLGCVLTLATSADAAKPGPTSFGTNPKAGSTFDFNGTHFYYETYGHGQPVLLIHGNGGSIADFKAQISEFSHHHTVIALDSRGHGKSEPGTVKLTYEQMAEDTNALLDHLKLEHIKVLGWSDGGIIGLLLAIHHPDKVGMLAVMGANLEPEGAYPWATDGIVKVRARLNAELAHSKNPAALQFQLQLLDLLGNQPHIPPAELAQIQVPTLVMAGDRDVIIDTHTLTIFHALPKSQLAIFPGMTHMAPQENPLLFNHTVLDFFDQPFKMPDSKDLGWFD